MKKIIDVYSLMAGIEKYVLSGAIAGVTGVEWHEDSSAFTDGTTIHLPRPNALWTEEQLLVWRYKAEHELGHEDAVNANPHWKVVMEDRKKDAKYKDDGFLWWVANLISDHVQERNRIGEMIGRDYVLKEGRNTWLHKEMYAAVEKKKKLDKDEAVGSGLFLWDTRSRKSWNERIVVPAFAKEAHNIADMVETKSGVCLDKLHNEEDVFNAAVKVRKLFPEIPASNDFLGTLSKMKAKAVGADGEPCEDGAAPAYKSDKSIPFTPTGGHDTRERMPYSYEKTGGSYVPRVPVSRETGGRGVGFAAGAGTEHENRVKILLRSTNLPAKVRAYLMAMKREKYTTGWRSGRLDTSRLPDILRGKDDLFRRKEPVRLVDSAVYLLVDSSGSMTGKPFQHACASGVMLAEALQGIGCSVEIAGFTEFSGGKKGLIHDIWVPFGGRFVRDFVLNKMGKMSHCLCNNVDGENILYAYSRLKKQKETRKILIVLSDGEPSGAGPRGASMGVASFTKQVCEEIEKDKNVLLVGLGMSGYSPSRFYKNAFKVEHGQPLEPVLLDIVKNAVLR